MCSEVFVAFYQGQNSSADLPNSGHQAERSDGDAAPDSEDDGNWKYKLSSYIRTYLQRSSDTSK